MSQIKSPPYSVPHAHKLVADFEHAVRKHEMLGAQHPMDQPLIEKHYLAEREKLVLRLTMPKEPS